MSDPHLAAATQLLSERSGVTVPAYRWPLLAAELRRLGRGDLERGLATFRGGDPALFESVASVFAVGETYLFRGPDHFGELRRLAERSAAAGQPFEVLCAGVSTGEEAWSAVLVLAAAYEATNLPYFVVGWDLSQERLQRARLARFRRWSTRSGLMGYDRYLIETEDGHAVDPRLRHHARFEHVNLVEPLPDPQRTFDAIFFRNVSMYWSRRQASEVARALGRRLAPGGSLLIGPSDPIELPSEEWSVELVGTSLVYRRVEPRPAPVVSASPAAPRRPSPRPTIASAAMTSTPTRASSRAIAARSTTAALVERVRALADRGDYERALELLADRDPSDPELLELEGIVQLSRGDLDAAVERFRAAVYWAPSVLEYTRWLELAITSRERQAPRGDGGLPA